jgi:KDO2-lipid IV(A) lauroyltransferase
MKKVVWLIEAGLFIILSIPVAILPLKLSIKAGEILGLLVFYLWGSRRRIAIENLENSISSNAITTAEPAEKVIRDNFKNLGKSFAEVIKIYYGFGKKVIDSVDIEGIENFNQAKSKGKGILSLTGHCGNWELMAIATSAKLSGITIVARPINNPYINKFVESIRQKYGNSVIYKQKALKPIIQALKNNDSVGILMDQAVIPGEGYVIDFLGRGAWTTKMPALLARKTGAAVLPAFIHRTDGRHKIKIYPQVELSGDNDKENAIKEDTKKFSRYIEEYIKEHPSEWLWIHRRWKRVNSNQ